MIHRFRPARSAGFSRLWPSNVEGLTAGVQVRPKPAKAGAPGVAPGGARFAGRKEQLFAQSPFVLNSSSL